MIFQKKISLLAMAIALVSIAPSFAAEAPPADSKKPLQKHLKRG